MLYAKKWIYILLFEQKKKLESHKNICENKDICGFLIPSEDSKILKFNQYWKSDKKPSVFYPDLEFLNVKTILKNDPKQK